MGGKRFLEVPLRLSKVLFEDFGTITAERQLLRTHYLLPCPLSPGEKGIRSDRGAPGVCL